MLCVCFLVVNRKRRWRAGFERKIFPQTPQPKTEGCPEIIQRIGKKAIEHEISVDARVRILWRIWPRCRLEWLAIWLFFPAFNNGIGREDVFLGKTDEKVDGSADNVQRDEDDGEDPDSDKVAACRVGIFVVLAGGSSKNGKEIPSINAVLPAGGISALAVGLGDKSRLKHNPRQESRSQAQVDDADSSEDRIVPYEGEEPLDNVPYKHGSCLYISQRLDIVV